ncbi:MAG: DUF6266 family protein [Daejeonella sp.]|uniref:DUF6266 family protein n=1 Tax=Daejeonella sp. TaxID=2805397 RepID=UPI0027370886|nr:DUF6266 family protein [Daejeonella sp.]MDP3468287.1 DUF6266 family protein [Daejeonella sp.]
MAQQSGILYPISGRIGDKIYCNLNGKTYIRSLAKKSGKAPSEKQLIQRAKFSLVSGFLFPLIRVINESYRKINPKKIGMKMVFGPIYSDAIRGEYPDFELDYSRITLIRGNLQRPYCSMNYVAGTNELDFSWIVANPGYEDGGDVLWPLIHCSALNEFWYELDSGIRRDDEFCTIRIPQLFIGHEIQVWLAYRSANGKAFSDSSYIGKVFTH